MLVATFGPTTAWEGKQITYDGGRFVLQGYGEVPPAALVDYDRQGHLLWVSPEMRDWGYAMERWAAGAAQQQGGPAQAQQGGPAASAAQAQPGFLTRDQAAAPGKKFPVWAIVLIVVAALVVFGGCAAAVSIPMFCTQNDKAHDAAVKEGIHSIQIGIQSWAVDHGDVYPDPSMVNQVGLASYVDNWPANPYTGQPMAVGMSRGDYWYTVSPDAKDFSLTGYGTDGQAVITVPLSGSTLDQTDSI